MNNDMEAPKLIPADQPESESTMSDLPNTEVSLQSETKIATIEAKKVAEEVAKVSKIKSTADMDAAVALLARIRQTAKNISAKKDAIIRPLNISIKEIRELFRAPEETLTNAERDIKKAMLDYQAKIEAAAEKKAAKIEEKVNDGQMDLGTAVGKMSNIPRVAGKVASSEGGAVQFRTVRKVRIINVGEIPARYFADEKVLDALRIAVSKDALAGVAIPGVEVYEEKQVAGA